jgi:O-antigen ligase
MSESSDPLELVRKLAESFRQIKFGSGVVGKTSHGMLAVVGVWAIVAWRLSADFLQDAALLGAATAVTGLFVWWTLRTQAFAEKNPGLALLEGAQLLEYQRFVAQTKGLPPVAAQPMIHEAGASRATTADPDERSE